MKVPPVLMEIRPEPYLHHVRRIAPAFLAGWSPSEGDPGYAVSAGFARFMAALGERVNQAPDKNKLAFYDMLGLSALSASAGRTPVVFDPIPHAGNAPVPQGTRVAAEGETEPVVFTLEHPIVVPAARLTEVWSVWRGRDEAANHSEAAIRGRPFAWFDRAEAIEHHLYLAHGRILDLDGPSWVEVRLDLNRPAVAPLDVVWEYWDGSVWSPFRDMVAPEDAGPDDSVDGTRG